MRNINFISINLLAVFLLPFSGCVGSNFAPVSGTVTSDGQPVPNLRVVLTPTPMGGDNDAGPFSQGVTDANGKFTLETRYGDPGAFVGQHTTSFKYADIAENAMGELRDEMAEAEEAGNQERVQAAEAKIAKLKEKLAGRPVLMQRYNATITIPAGGTDDLKIELSEMNGR